MMKRNFKRRIMAAVLCVLLILVSIPARAEDAAVITHFDISPSGVAEICGYVSEKGEQVAILMTTGDGTVVTPETVIYIDQIEAGRNGAFILEFIVPEKWAGGEYTIGVGGQNVSATRQRGTLGALPAMICRVDDNSIRVGVDIYDFGAGAFTPENVAASLAYGGNTVFYKIGGMWFDLMHEEATSSAYLVEENAIPEEEYTAWEIRVYYAPGQILEGV